MIIIGVAVGYFIGQYDIELDLLSIFFIIFFITLPVLLIPQLYIMFFTKNVNLVEKYIYMKRKHPYYALLIELTNGNFTKATDHACHLKSPFYSQTRKSAMASIEIELRNLRKAEITTQDIKNQDIRHHNLALIALLDANWEVFQHLKDKIKSKALQYALEAEAAFKNGNTEESERLGHLAIASCAGIQKWLFIKSLERQQKNPHRETYF